MLPLQAWLFSFLRFFLLRGMPLVVGRMEVEIDPAKRPVSFRLAENDGHLFVQRDSMAEIWTTLVVRLDRFFHQ